MKEARPVAEGPSRSSRYARCHKPVLKVASHSSYTRKMDHRLGDYHAISRNLRFRSITSSARLSADRLPPSRARFPFRETMLSAPFVACALSLKSPLIQFLPEIIEGTELDDTIFSRSNII